MYTETSTGSWGSLGNKIDGFGSTFDLNHTGTIIVVGSASHDNNKGLVSVFEYSGTGNWIKQGSDIIFCFIKSGFKDPK